MNSDSEFSNVKQLKMYFDVNVTCTQNRSGVCESRTGCTV